jgi:hypothetical protein
MFQFLKPFEEAFQIRDHHFVPTPGLCASLGS